MRIRSLSRSIVSFRRPLVPLLALLLLVGCAAQSSRTASDNASTVSQTKTIAPDDPTQWIGRWHGPGKARLTLRPDTDGHYKLALRNRRGVTLHHQAQASGGRLYFQRGGKTLAIYPGRGSETNDPALAKHNDCLIIRPGGHGYCRHADTADALPLVKGAYVKARSACHMARASDTIAFNGRGISRPGQNGCRATLISQQGIIFHLNDGCAAGDGSNETVSVPDSHHLALSNGANAPQLYRYCPSSRLPAPLQGKMP